MRMRANRGRLQLTHLTQRALYRALAMPLLVACSSNSVPPPAEPGNGVDSGSGASDGGSSGGGDSTVGDASVDASVPEAAAAAANEASPGTDVSEFVYPVNLDAGSDATPPPPVPQSCMTAGPGISDCAPDGGSCCAGSILPEGNLLRSYDGITPGYTNPSFLATVGSLWLDKYEITVGRYRRFVNAVVGGWQPAAGSGKHSHLNAGLGLQVAGVQGANEAGWDTSWNATLSTTADAWNTALACDPVAQTWTSTAGANEDLPANCMTWYEAYAFCIWDGGFLPSEAEWNYAASGGAEQRVYPWSVPATSATIDCSHANYYGAMMGTDSCVSPDIDATDDFTGMTNAVGSESPEGDGKWGQSDLAGNVFEWNLDWYAPYVVPCSNCASLTDASMDDASTTAATRVIRGGAFDNQATFLLASVRKSYGPASRTSSVGARCARAP
jgi:sulfatase modifying factor 1